MALVVRDDDSEWNRSVRQKVEIVPPGLGCVPPAAAQLASATSSSWYYKPALSPPPFLFGIGRRAIAEFILDDELSESLQLPTVLIRMICQWIDDADIRVLGAFTLNPQATEQTILELYTDGGIFNRLTVLPRKSKVNSKMPDYDVRRELFRSDDMVNAFEQPREFRTFPMLCSLQRSIPGDGQREFPGFNTSARAYFVAHADGNFHLTQAYSISNELPRPCPPLGQFPNRHLCQHHHSLMIGERMKTFTIGSFDAEHVLIVDEYVKTTKDGRRSQWTLKFTAYNVDDFTTTQCLFRDSLIMNGLRDSTRTCFKFFSDTGMMLYFFHSDPRSLPTCFCLTFGL
jgi:hypothetical protein